MKFLLDVCVSSRSLAEFLSAEGHDVISAITLGPEAPDETLLRIALEQHRVLVTNDKDFGELAFVRRHAHGVIVRLIELGVDQQVAALAELLRDHAQELQGATFVTVGRGRVRFRRPG